MPRLYIKGIGMMTGLIIGAGVFALPYAFAQAGVFWGTVHLVVSLFIVYFLHQWYGEVSFLHKKASTGLSDTWKCIWARKPSFSACSRPSALITALCLSTPLWAEFFWPISPACSTGRPFFSDFAVFRGGRADGPF